jgi:hypothetical protein
MKNYLEGRFPFFGFCCILINKCFEIGMGEGVPIFTLTPSPFTPPPLCAFMANALLQVQEDSTNNFNSFPELDTPSVVIEYLPFEKDDVLPGEISK